MVSIRKILGERDESEVTESELRSIYDSLRHIISKGKRFNVNATDLWHDVILAGKGIDWFNETIIPEYEKAKYPLFGSPAYGEWERDITLRIIHKQ
jgi:hypothetical protein